MLVLLAALPFWDSLRQRSRARALLAGVNAAVVGLLGAALYSLAWKGSVGTLWDLGLVLFGFVLLVAWRAAPLIVVAVVAGGAVAVALR